MLVAITLACVGLVAAGPLPSNSCTNGFIFNGRYYNPEVLLTVKSADEFTFDKTTNTLFFSYLYPVNKTGLFGAAYLNLDTKEFYDIPGISRGSTSTVDPKSGDVYLGSDDGVYKFNPQTKTAEYVTAKGVNVWSIFFYNGIFYSTFPDHVVHDSHGNFAFSKNPSIKIDKAAGNETEYFMTNATGLYRVFNDKIEPSERFTDPDPYLGYKGFSTDSNGSVYVFNGQTVYIPNRERKTVEKVADFNNLNGLAFDSNNNIIYSNDDAIIKLTPSNDICPAAATQN